MVDQGRKKFDVASELEIPTNTLSAWLKQRTTIDSFEGSASRKSMQKGLHPELEKVLVAWIEETRADTATRVSGTLIQEKAKEVAERMGVANFIASNGWLARFTARNQLRSNHLSGSEARSKSCDTKAKL